MVSKYESSMKKRRDRRRLHSYVSLNQCSMWIGVESDKHIYASTDAIYCFGSLREVSISPEITSRLCTPDTEPLMICNGPLHRKSLYKRTIAIRISCDECFEVKTKTTVFEQASTIKFPNGIMMHFADTVAKIYVKKKQISFSKLRIELVNDLRKIFGDYLGLQWKQQNS